MPISQPFYLNAPTLAQATAVYADNQMTECAPDGLYSDGTIIRELSGCKFISTDYIPPCNPPCNPPMVIECGGSAGENVFDMAINTGAAPGSVGAVVIEFEVKYYSGAIIAGIEVELNGVEYNAVVSPTEDYLAADAGYPTFIGVTDTGCISPIGSTPFTGEIYDWDGIGWVDSTFGLSYNVDQALNQDKTTATNPGICKMVVPKLTATPEQVNVRVYIPCGDSICTVRVNCPTLLPSFLCSVNFPTDPFTPVNPAFCPSPNDQKLYYVKVANVYPGQLEQYDMIFADPYGQVKATEGYYKVPSYMTPGGGYDSIYVTANGVLGALYTCP
jgi:hypothetical protein